MIHVVKCNSVDIPFLSHHQNTLDQDTLGDLGSNAFEQAQETLILDDELHNFYETLERLALS